mmetsp:Transcript_21752/g.31548  ORF Transcript_21752/g.31548 Transcript_21752/m.31548 type:complete len:262 (+) Transcript_21752:1095-1880(+)
MARTSSLLPSPTNFALKATSSIGSLAALEPDIPLCELTCSLKDVEKPPLRKATTAHGKLVSDSTTGYLRTQRLPQPQVVRLQRFYFFSCGVQFGSQIVLVRSQLHLFLPELLHLGFEVLVLDVQLHDRLVKCLQTVQSFDQNPLLIQSAIRRPREHQSKLTEFQIYALSPPLLALPLSLWHGHRLRPFIFRTCRGKDCETLVRRNVFRGPFPYRCCPPQLRFLFTIKSTIHAPSSSLYPTSQRPCHPSQPRPLPHAPQPHP